MSSGVPLKSGVVYNATTATTQSSPPNANQGSLRPHGVDTRSENAPISGSLTASQTFAPAKISAATDAAMPRESVM